MHAFISSLPNYIQSGAIPYELFILIAGYLEGLPVIGSLVPGGTLALIIGTYIQAGTVSFFWSVLGLSVGSFLGDLTGYLLGRLAKKSRFVQRIIAKERVQTGLEFFEKKLFIVLVVGRLIPVIRSAPSIVAGAHGIKLSKYLTYNALGSLLWSVAGIGLGMVTGKLVGKYAIPVIVLMTLSVVGYIFLRERKKQKVEQTDEKKK